MSSGEHVKIAKGKSRVKLKLPASKRKDGATEVTADELLELIQALGRAHRDLVAGRPVPALVGQKVDAIYNTKWHVHAELIAGAIALSFYHTAYGPVGFLIPIEQVEYMARLLSFHVEQSRADPASPQ